METFNSLQSRAARGAFFVGLIALSRTILPKRMQLIISELIISVVLDAKRESVVQILPPCRYFEQNWVRKLSSKFLSSVILT